MINNKTLLMAVVIWLAGVFFGYVPWVTLGKNVIVWQLDRKSAVDTGSYYAQYSAVRRLPK